MSVKKKKVILFLVTPSVRFFQTTTSRPECPSHFQVSFSNGYTARAHSEKKKLVGGKNKNNSWRNSKCMALKLERAQQVRNFFQKCVYSWEKAMLYTFWLSPPLHLHTHADLGFISLVLRVVEVWSIASFSISRFKPLFFRTLLFIVDQAWRCNGGFRSRQSLPRGTRCRRSFRKERCFRSLKCLPPVYGSGEWCRTWGICLWAHGDVEDQVKNK